MPRRTIVQQGAKHFAERLNKCMDDIGAPTQLRERAVVLSKLLGVPKQQAWSLLGGHQVPDQALLEKIAKEFEVDSHWLFGSK